MQHAGPSQTYLYDIRTDKHERTKLMFGTGSNEEYFHVDILTDKSEHMNLQLEKTVDEILNLNKYKCYICNIEVPKPYVIEHNNSAKHKACNKIANIALERTRHQMQLDIPVRRKIEVLDTYFCEPCATVVLNSDKQTHQATKIHKIFLKQDEVLNDMVKIYEDIEYIEVNSEIDELELLKERIKNEYLQDIDVLCQETKIITCDKISSEITKLEWLKEKIEQESQENTELQSTKAIKGKTEGIRNVLHTEKIQDKVTQLNEFVSEGEYSVARENINAAALNGEISKSGEKLKNIKLVSSPIQDHRNSIENIGTQFVKPKNISKKKALKKLQIAKKKECSQNRGLHKNCGGIKNIEINFEVDELDKDSQENQNTGFNTDKSIIEKQTNIANTDEPLDKLTSRIEAVMSKYFDNSRTVAGLINNIQNENNKNKANNILKKKSSMAHFNLATEIKNQKHEIEENNNVIESVITVNTATNENNTFTEEERTQNETKQKLNTKDHKLPEKNQNKKDKKKPNDQDNIKIQPTTSNVSKPTKPKAPTFQLVFYLKDLTRRCEIRPIHTVEALTDNIVQIAAINRDKFKVPVNNFHSFHVKSNVIYCMICECLNVRRPEWHVVESKHREKVMTPIIDLDGIRQLDDIWSHCILCNDLINSIDIHLQTLHHKNKVKQTLVQRGNDPSPETQKIHEKQKPNKKNVALTELMLINNLAMTSRGYLHCIICDLMIDNNLPSVTQHINSFHHLDKFEQQLSENQVVNTVEERFYCIPCDIQLGMINVITHCNGKKHGKLLDEYLTKEDQENVETQDEVVLSSISQNVKKSYKDKMEDSELICFVCNVIIHSIDEHTDTFDHKKSYLLYLESNKLNEIEPDTFYCIPCNTVIGIDYLMSHCMSRKHKRILQCFLCRNTGHKTNNVFAKEENQDNNDRNYCNKQDLPGNMKSNVCNEHKQQDKTDCNICISEEHQDNTDNVCDYQGGQDKIKFNICNDEEHQGNTDRNVSDKRRCQDKTDCNISNADNTNRNVCNEHDQGKTKFNISNAEEHQDNTNGNVCNKHDQDETKCKIYNVQPHENNTVCNVQQDQDNTASKDNEQGHPSSLFHSVNVAMPIKVLYQFQELELSNNLLCTVCDEEVAYTRKTASYHISTLDHVVAFNLTMLWNKIKKRNDKYFCDICLTDITYFSEICHVLGQEHTDNLAKEPKGTVYEYDRTLVTHAYAMSHKVGDRVRPTPIVSHKSLDKTTH